MVEEKTYLAIVEKIITAGRHGPYAVAKSDELKSVTFSLSKPVWEEIDLPEPGTYVMLTRVFKKRAGWRAKQGRFMQPSDQEQLNSKPSKEQKA